MGIRVYDPSSIIPCSLPFPSPGGNQDYHPMLNTMPAYTQECQKNAVRASSDVFCQLGSNGFRGIVMALRILTLPPDLRQTGLLTLVLDSSWHGFWINSWRDLFQVLPYINFLFLEKNSDLIDTCLIVIVSLLSLREKSASNLSIINEGVNKLWLSYFPLFLSKWISVFRLHVWSYRIYQNCEISKTFTSSLIVGISSLLTETSSVQLASIRPPWKPSLWLRVWHWHYPLKISWAVGFSQAKPKPKRMKEVIYQKWALPVWQKQA